jgi:hypothetical protein
MTHDYILLARIYHVRVKIERWKIFAATTELTPNFAAHGRHTASRRSSDHNNDVRCSNACASTGYGLAHRRAGQNLARLGPNAYHDALCQVNNADVSPPSNFARASSWARVYSSLTRVVLAQPPHSSHSHPNIARNARKQGWSLAAVHDDVWIAGDVPRCVAAATCGVIICGTRQPSLPETRQPLAAFQALCPGTSRLLLRVTHAVGPCRAISGCNRTWLAGLDCMGLRRLKLVSRASVAPGSAGYAAPLYGCFREVGGERAVLRHLRMLALVA